MYSLVPKERHVRKKSHDCSLSLCIGCKERHGSTFGQSIDPKDRHVCTDWLFLVHKIIPKFGYDPKERHDYYRLFVWTFFRNNLQLRVGETLSFSQNSLSFCRFSLIFCKNSLSLRLRLRSTFT